MATKMAQDVHVTVTSSVIHNPGQTALHVGAGIPVVATGSTKDKTAKVSGQVANTSVIIRNPA